MRSIYMEFPESELPAVKVRLLENVAPRTCKYIWDILENPLHNRVWHAPFLGRAIVCRYSIPAPPEDLLPENLTITPGIGDIVLANFTEKTGRSRGQVSGEGPFALDPDKAPGSHTGIDSFYGPDGLMLIPMGFHAVPCFGHVEENLSSLASMGYITREHGSQAVIFKRAE